MFKIDKMKYKIQSSVSKIQSWAKRYYGRVACDVTVNLTPYHESTESSRSGPPRALTQLALIR